MEPVVRVSVGVSMEPLSMEPRASVSISMETLDRSTPGHSRKVEIQRDSPPVALAIGAPGTGKSVLGKHLETTSNGKAVFVSVGEILRERGLLANVDSGDLRATAVEILRGAVSDAVASGKILLLECVKEIEDAFSLMEILETSGMQLSQVLLIPRHGIVPDILLSCKERELSTSFIRQRRARDAERKPFDRQAKWNANASRLIDFFSSLGVLDEVLPKPKQLFSFVEMSKNRLTLSKLNAIADASAPFKNGALASALREGRKTKFSLEELQSLGVKVSIIKRPKRSGGTSCDQTLDIGDFINVGNRMFRFETNKDSDGNFINVRKIVPPREIIAPRTETLIRTTDLLTKKCFSRRIALEGGITSFLGLSQAGYGKVKSTVSEENPAPGNVLRPPDGLVFAPLEPVVSQRLVSNRTLRDRVLGYAAASTGLESLITGASPLPVPSSFLGKFLL